MEPRLTAEQFYLQPASILSEEFVVIPDNSPSSPESEPNSTDYQLPLARQRSTEPSEIQKMAEQISQVKDKHSSLQGGLVENSNSLEQIRGLMTNRLIEMKAALIDKNNELNAKTEQCACLQESNQKMKAELVKLRNKEEEWNQTSQDYQKLKNEYGLLTNTKERLETEKADLQRSRDEAVAAEAKRLRDKFDEERSAALDAERAKHKQELTKLQADHAVDIRNLELKLTGALKEGEANLQTARDEKEQALAAEQERCHAEAERLLAEHTNAMQALRKEFEDKILEQHRLLEEAKREMEESNAKYEAEKKEMFEMLSQFNVSSFATGDFGSVGTNTEATLEDIRTVQSMHNRLAIQEHGPSSMTPAPSITMAQASACFSVATSDAAVGTSVDMTRAAIDAASQTVIGLSSCPDGNLTEAAGGDVSTNTRSEESQTDPMECPQVENAESLQKNSKTRNLMVQLAAFAQALTAERKKNEDLEKDLKQQQQESSDLLNQLTGLKAAISSQRDEEVSRLRKQLTDKQIELDSLLKDFDETRHKVYDLNEAVKDFKNRAEDRAQKANCRATSVGEQAASRANDGDTARLQKQLFDKQSELDSVLLDFDETRHKVYELSEKVKDYENRAQIRNRENQTPEGISPGQGRASQYAQEQIGKLRKQLAEKQDELDSLLKDFDETRHRVYELNQQIKDLQSRSAQSDTAVEKLRQTNKDLEAQAVIEKNLANELQMEIDSHLKGEQFKATKLQAAENEAEQLRQEIQRLTSDLEEHQRKCREADQTVQQILTNSDSIKRERDELKTKCQAQEEALDDNRKKFEEKANLEIKLRETIADLVDRLKRQVDDSDQTAKDEKRKFEQLYNKLCKEADDKKNAQKLLDQALEQQQQAQNELNQIQQQFNQAKQQNQQLQQQLNEATVRLQDSEKFAADLQGYCDGVDKKLQETVEKRDSVIQMCEQLRHVFEAEQQRSAYAESELQKLNLEYSKLRLRLSVLQAEYTAAAQSATDLMAREQNLQAQLEQTQEKLRQAEEAIGMYKDELMVKENEIEKLKGRLNCLLENVACLEEQHIATGDAEFVNRHRTLPRPSRGGNN